MSAWIIPDSNTHSGYHFVEANWDAFHADEAWHRGPEVRLYDPAVNKVVTMRLLDICQALWAAQAALATAMMEVNPQWRNDDCWDSLESMVAWASDGEMYREHIDESCEQGSIAGAVQEMER